MESLTMKISSRHTPASAEFVQLAICRALAKKAGIGSHTAIAEQLGSPRVQRVIEKAPQSALNTSDQSVLLDMQMLAGSFIDSLQHSSVFFRMHGERMFIAAPFRTKFAYQTIAASGWLVEEGAAVPLSGIALGLESLVPETAAAIVVATNQLLASSKAEGALGRALRRAVSDVVDARFIDNMLDGAPTIAAQNWSGPEDVAVDLRALLEQVSPTSESRLMIIASPANVRALAAEMGIGGSPAFPGVTVTGGTIWGIDIMPSDSIEAETVLLLDGARIAADVGSVDVDISGEASLEMLTADLVQNSVTSTATELLSLFQTNSSAIRVTAEFGAVKIAPNAAAALTGAAWGGELPVS